MLRVCVRFGLATVILLSCGAMAQRPLNIPTPTLGGKQFWGDVYLYGGWRIQQNVLTQGHRLLDARDLRRAWGTLAHCEAALAEARAAGKAVLRSTRVCVLIHGYLRSKDSLRTMAEALRAAGFEVYSINYPSSQLSLEVLCTDTARLVARVSEDFEQVNVVTHSMGGIVARGALSDAPLKGGGRMVMLAPPNQGARMAELLLTWWPSQYISGPAGKELATSAEAFARRAGTPKSPFMIIAGGRGDDAGYNSALPGDDDGVVSVAETHLDGAAEEHAVLGLHTFIMNAPEAIALTRRFLE